MSAGQAAGSVAASSIQQVATRGSGGKAPGGDAAKPGARSRLAPGALVAAMVALMGMTLLIVFLAPREHEAADRMHDTVARERLLRFTDRDDGAVVVTDGATGQPLGVVTGQNGFLRVSLTGLVRIRHLNGIGAESPFKLTSYADGRLTLSDPATRKEIELEAFGPTNEAVFGWFLSADQPARPD